MMILIVSAVTFALLGLAGDDALASLRENPHISEQTLENMRRIYGLDQPLPVRYFKWLGGALSGDLGDSMYFRVPVSNLVWVRFMSTLLLGGAALVIAVVVSFALGIAAARFRNKWLDSLVEGLAFFHRIDTADRARAYLACDHRADHRGKHCGRFGFIILVCRRCTFSSIDLNLSHSAARRTHGNDDRRLRPACTCQRT